VTPEYSCRHACDRRQAEAAPAVTLSWQLGRMATTETAHTRAEGIAVRSPNPTWFAVMKDVADDMNPVSEESTADTERELTRGTRYYGRGRGSHDLGRMPWERWQWLSATPHNREQHSADIVCSVGMLSSLNRRLGADRGGVAHPAGFRPRIVSGSIRRRRLSWRLATRPTRPDAWKAALSDPQPRPPTSDRTWSLGRASGRLAGGDRLSCACAPHARAWLASEAVLWCQSAARGAHLIWRGRSRRAVGRGGPVARARVDGAGRTRGSGVWPL
jgi:hypothetical protein